MNTSLILDYLKELSQNNNRVKNDEITKKREK